MADDFFYFFPLHDDDWRDVRLLTFGTAFSGGSDCFSIPTHGMKHVLI